MCHSCGNPSKFHVGAKSYDKFVNLHLHTAYSLLDGMSKPEDVIKKVASLNQTAVAVTEHGNVFSAVKVHKLAKKENIKHIYGAEFYITEDRFVKDKDRKYFHLTVLAKNEKGRQNINKLASLGYIEGFYFKPRIDHKILKEYSEGLIVLSGCMASEVQQALAGGKIGDGDIEITENNKANAKRVIKWYRETFGADYYLEVQAHRDYRQQKLNRAIIDLAIELGIEYVATTDSHFVDNEDHELHSIFIQIGTNREAGETYEDTFIMSAKDVYDRLTSFSVEEREIAIRNSLVIADKCDVRLPLSEPIIPHVPIPDEYDSEMAYLKVLINQGWKRRKINQKPNKEYYNKRLMYEFNAITKMGFEGYFLLVDSYVNSVRRRGIARGSSGGSLIAWLLGITDVDPLKFGLYFERFIDVGALELLESGQITRKELKVPDVDSDFGASDREKVVEFIIERYGADKFASIGQFGFIWDKSAIKDVGRVLNIPYQETNQFTQQLGNMTIEYIREAGLFSEWFEKYPKLFEYAEKLAGLPRSFGVHPCGKIVSIKNKDFYTAVASNDGSIVYQADMDDLEDLGLVKVDLLGLKSIDVIYDTLEMIGKDYEYINPDTLNFDDEKVLALFRTGQTDGVFQFESVGMKETLRQVVPDGIEDLAVCNALFRPASMKHIEHYAKRKKGEEEFEYLHPDLEPILSKTYGILVFQEQLIEIAWLANMKNPDKIRKATAKKKMDLMTECKEELFEGLSKRGWNEWQLNTLWEIMIDFASYSFNKSHAVAYAIIAWQMAKQKVYHPIEFMTALLNSKIGKIEEVSHYISECKRMGIKVDVPNINTSAGEFTIKDAGILFGLLAIKGVGEPTVDLIEDIRKFHKKPFESFVQFYNYMVEMSNHIIVDINSEGNKIATLEMLPTDAIINLIKSGAFGSNKDEIIVEFGQMTYTPLKWKPRATVPSKSDFTKAGFIITDEDYKDKELRKQLFNDFKYKEYLKKDEERKLKHLNGFTDKYIGQIEYYEFEAMGTYLTMSPFDSYMKYLKDFYTYENGTDKVLVVGTIIGKDVKKSSRGGQHAKLQVLTPYGVVQVRAYSTQYSEYKNLLNKGETIVVLAKRNKDEAIISKLKTFDEWKQIIDRKRVKK
ncbi:putative DNA polymerase III subunit alpha [Brevibacillus phage Sundance]|uniref:DNA polymerase n=1 Tax=Brevibacillus phage Sundance TaxID=1691958 RepID=UPI0006BD4750|nr:DNA polymerase [Brevibacillus phage Sundance]ALA47886.1 putative DNA polymerase III subunit alpha [Brevibacillus phage Sundance]